MEQEGPRADLDLEVLTQIIAAFKQLDDEAKQRVFDAVATFLGFSVGHTIAAHGAGPGVSAQRSFSTDRAISPKEFLLEKQPRTDVHRVACLAFYLTHYRDTPHFKTIDISKLNTEAAQPKFSNAAKSVDNATALGYLAPAVKGTKQMSATGERFVQALPDLDAAKAVIASAKPRRKQKKTIAKGDDETRDGGKAES
jgi:hypothetical protein